MDVIFSEPFSYEIIVKLIVAATLSLIIGIERELKKKPVGLKTSLVIATFSCLLTIISIETAYSTPARDDINITMDPLRLAAQIVSGIGFLGAGVILRKGNDSITGLTTAAMIWGAAGIGIAVGAGFYIEAFATVVIVVIGIELIAPFLLKIGPKRIRMKELVLKVRLDEEENIRKLLAFMKENEMHIDNIRIKDIPVSSEQFLYEVDMRLSTLFRTDTLTIYQTLHSLPYVQKIEIENLG
ncbi:MgtC/SapB family protein [Lysinibacillus telephonicus]|uniref:MgtC/SapB family protein n=1 Tax=Lysinibacillus telephonicus TaxID=1714840 RepID=A0A3S0HXW7_9BACI|nr:MgtC/SapB family protein [Lysinibacillus telephonicus]RTQ90197.1 MgtC/SapB family protein [Lysinibacillus telephonicus]